MFRSSLLALALLSSCADARQLEDLGQLQRRSASLAEVHHPRRR